MNTSLPSHKIESNEFIKRDLEIPIYYENII